VRPAVCTFIAGDRAPVFAHPYPAAEILGTLQRQAADIANLRSEVAQCGTRADLAALERGVASRLAALDRRLDALEADTAVELPVEALEALLGTGTAAAARGDDDDDGGGGR
jgi:hypothetical protein